jgi:hypothetical protein
LSVCEFVLFSYQDLFRQPEYKRKRWGSQWETGHIKFDFPHVLFYGNASNDALALKKKKTEGITNLSDWLSGAKAND